MKLKGMLAAGVVAAASVVGIATAQEPAEGPATLADIIEMRQRIMMANEQAAKIMVGMLRNQLPYDANVVAALMSTISHDNAVFPTLFLPGTETGNGAVTGRPTEVAPAVWTGIAEFAALSNKMAADAHAASLAAGGDRNAFLVAFKTVTDNCTACHEKFRVEKEQP